MQETWEMRVQSLGRKDALDEGMATHFTVLARRTPWTEEPGGLPSTGWQRIRNDWSNLAHMCVSLWPDGPPGPPGSSVHEVSQARILEWVAISSSRRSSQHRDGTLMSLDSPALASGFSTTVPPGKSMWMNTPWINTGKKQPVLQQAEYPLVGHVLDW